MTSHMVSGILLTAVVLGAVVFLALKCRRIIERIHSHRPGSLRHIQKEILNEKELSNRP